MAEKLFQVSSQCRRFFVGVSTSEKLLPFVNQTMVDQQKVLTGFGMMSYDVVMYWYDVVCWLQYTWFGMIWYVTV